MLNTFSMHNIRKYRNTDNIGPMVGERRTAREEEKKMLGRKKEDSWKSH